MSVGCSRCEGVEARFAERTAGRDLRRYRKRGASRETGMLLRALHAAGVDGATLLDIGGGVGALQHELLEGGAARAVGVDASSAYLDAARDEARRRGLEHRVEYRHADFVEVAEGIPPCDVVTLDRVICCYEDVRALVGLSAGRARRYWGAVFPRDTLLVRLGIPLENLFERVRGIPFRVYLHPPDLIDGLLAERGFGRRFRARTLLWEVVLWERRGEPPARPARS